MPWRWFLRKGGEFALVVFALASQTGLLNETLFQELLLAVLLSMFATPVLARVAHQLVQSPSAGRAEPQKQPASAPVVLAGFGGVGHRIGQILALADIPYVAIDRDVSRVAHERTEGQPVFFGEAHAPEVLRSAGACDASLVIVTLDDLEAAEGWCRLCATRIQNCRFWHEDTIWKSAVRSAGSVPLL